MSESYCPICYTPLEKREVAPCYDCGHDPDELRQLAAGEHEYAEVEVLGARAVLCDFCQGDFSSQYLRASRASASGQRLDVVDRHVARHGDPREPLHPALLLAGQRC